MGKRGKNKGKIGKEKRIKESGDGESENDGCVSHAYLPSSTYQLFCFLCKEETTLFWTFNSSSHFGNIFPHLIFVPILKKA